MLYAHIYTFFASVLFLGIFITDFVEQIKYLIKDITVIRNSNNYEMDITTLRRRKKALWHDRVLPIILEILTMIYMLIVLIDSMHIISLRFNPSSHFYKFFWG